MHKHFKAATVIASFVLLAACSDDTKSGAKTDAEPKKEAAAPPEPVTGKTAFYEMYKPARSWASDLSVLSLAADETPGMKIDDGKAGTWTCVFASHTKRAARTFKYAVVENLPNVLKGVNMSSPTGWSGPTANSEPFQMTEVSVNSDEAFQTALEKAKPWIKDHPGKPVSMSLGKAHRFPAPVWYILWGDNKVGYRAFIDATTGKAVSGK